MIWILLQTKTVESKDSQWYCIHVTHYFEPLSPCHAKSGPLPYRERQAEGAEAEALVQLNFPASKENMPSPTLSI